MKTEPNQQAFASEGSGAIEHSGLTKREYFAAMAMQGLIGNNESMKNLEASGTNFIEIAVQAADALIAELNKEQK